MHPLPPRHRYPPGAEGGRRRVRIDREILGWLRSDQVMRKPVPAP